MPQGRRRQTRSISRTAASLQAREVRIEGEQVVFSQYGATQTIPLVLVDRVVSDSRTPAGGYQDPEAAGSRSRPLSPEPLSSSDAASAAANSTATGTDELGSVLASVPPSERLQILSGLFNEAAGGDAGVDPTQALGLLQLLGGQGSSDGGLQRGPSGGIKGGSGRVEGSSGRVEAGSGGAEEGLGNLLGTLSSGLGGDLGALGADLGQAQTLLPALTQLGQALFAPEYSQENTTVAVDELLRVLAAAGVSRDELDARAQGFGVPPGMLERQQ